MSRDLCIDGSLRSSLTNISRRSGVGTRALPCDREHSVQHQRVARLEASFRFAFAFHDVWTRIPAGVMSGVANRYRGATRRQRIGSGAVHRQRMVADHVTGIAVPGDEAVLRVILELGEIGTWFEACVGEFRVLVGRYRLIELAPAV